jgi:hypothetical protein
MIDKDERIKVQSAQIDKVSKKAGIYEKGLRAVMTHLEMILGEQARMSGTYHIVSTALRKAGKVE